MTVLSVSTLKGKMPNNDQEKQAPTTFRKEKKKAAFTEIISTSQSKMWSCCEK